MIIRGGTVVDGTGAPGRIADVGINDGRIVDHRRDRRRQRDAHDRRRGQGRRARVRRHPHALRRPGLLGHDAVAVAVARRDDGHRRQLRLHDRAARPGARRLPHAHARPRRGHAARGARRRACRGTGGRFGEYLDRIDGTLAPNAGFLVGHSTIRRVAMGERATEGRGDGRRPRRDACAARREPRSRAGSASRRAGRARTTTRPATWCRRATRARTRSSRCAVSSRIIPGTTLEFIPCVGMFEEFAPELLTRMSLAANRPINWNVLFVGKGSEAITEHNLAASDYATEHGARVIALTVPFSPSPRICFDSGFLLDTIPGWEKPMALPHDEKKAMLASPDGRDVLREAALQPTTGLQGLELGHLRHQRDVRAREQAVGRQVGRRDRQGARRRRVRRAVRHRRRRRPHDRLRLPDRDPTTTRRGKSRMKVWRDGRAVVGASDAGAHLDFLATFNYSTVLLGGPVRERGLDADRRGDQPPHRRARAALRPDRAAAGCKRAGTPTSS